MTLPPAFLMRLSDVALLALRRDVRNDEDAETMAAIDAEIQRRSTPQHAWHFYMNGTFCTRCGAQIGDGRACR